MKLEENERDWGRKKIWRNNTIIPQISERSKFTNSTSVRPKQSKFKENEPRHIIKLLKIKDKEKLPEAASEKQYVTYRETVIQIIIGFSSEAIGSQKKIEEYP